MRIWIRMPFFLINHPFPREKYSLNFEKSEGIELVLIDNN